jgi:hypothetical protein
MISDVAAEVMVERSSFIIQTYFQVKALSEQIPSRKLHSDELVFVLNELLKLDLFAGALKCKTMKGTAQMDPLRNNNSKKRSHIFLFHFFSFSSP